MHLFNILPMSDQRYNAGMKRLGNTFKFGNDDEVLFRLEVLEHAQKYGWRSACDAYHVGHSAFFEWKKKYKENGLAGLKSLSTRPHTYRQSRIDPRLVAYIKELRQDCGNIGRQKLKIFIDEYARQIGVDTLSERSIGRIISKYNLFTPTRKQKTKRKKLPENRSKYAPKVEQPGFVEVDCITLQSWCQKFLFVCFIDVYSRLAYVERVSSLTALNATGALQNCQTEFPFPITTVQTDNGSEFLREFDQHLQAVQIPHYFTLPHSPRINGCVERFNRTIQEEFLNLTDTMFCAPKHFQLELTDWLSWYNTVRPHAALGYQTPWEFLQSNYSGM